MSSLSRHMPPRPDIAQVLRAEAAYLDQTMHPGESQHTCVCGWKGGVGNLIVVPHDQQCDLAPDLVACPSCKQVIPSALQC